MGNKTILGIAAALFLAAIVIAAITPAARRMLWPFLLLLPVVYLGIVRLNR